MISVHPLKRLTMMSFDISPRALSAFSGALTKTLNWVTSPSSLVLCLSRYVCHSRSRINGDSGYHNLEEDGSSFNCLLEQAIGDGNCGLFATVFSFYCIFIIDGVPHNVCILSCCQRMFLDLIFTLHRKYEKSLGKFITYEKPILLNSNVKLE